jgi:glycerol uptake operon antiterminator
MSSIIEGIRENPIVAAIRRSEDTQDAIDSCVSTIFILNTDIFNVKELVARIKSSGKNVLVHIDFVEGLGKDHKAIDYIAQYAKPDGIISTKSQQIKYARESGIFAIQRFFLVDSLSMHTTLRSIQSLKPDMVEIMPAIMPDVIARITRQIDVPVIAGGLIDSKKDIIEILKAGALGASTGKKELWSL